MLTMYDSAAPQFIPVTAKAVAGYIDGDKWAPEYWTRFKSARKFRISIAANPLADIFDVETGTAGILSVKEAVASRANVFLSSVVYCSLDNWPTNKQALADLPVAWWIADYLENGHTPSAPMEGAAGWQYVSINPRYDISVIDTASWPNFKGLG